MIPRRFYSLAVFCAFALCVLFFLLTNRNDLSVALPSGWTGGIQTNHDGDGRSTTAKADALEGDRSGGDTKEEGAGKKNGFVQFHEPVEEKKKENKNKDESPYPPPDPPLPNPFRVAVLDSSGIHEETAAAFIYTLGVRNETQLSLYMLQSRNGIGELINTFNLSQPLALNRSSEDFERAVIGQDVPHLVVSTTCEADLVTLEKPLKQLLEARSTYLFCVIHQPERWRNEDLTSRLRPWMEEQLVDLVTLSQHTAHHLRIGVISAWDFNSTVNVRHMAPLYPIELTDANITFPELHPSKKDVKQYPIAMHGDFDASRHNYTDVYNEIEHLNKRAASIEVKTAQYTRTEQRDVNIQILGERNPPGIPKKAKGLINLHHDLPIQRQYEEMSKSYVLIPEFSSVPDAKSDYVSKLASHSIPAALMAGVPLAVDESILQAYSYLPRDAVWFKYPGEHDMKVAERVALWAEEEIRKKKIVVMEKCKMIIERNVQVVAEWVDVGWRRVERAGWLQEWHHEQGINPGSGTIDGKDTGLEPLSDPVSDDF